jgi:hypothetical protein
MNPKLLIAVSQLLAFALIVLGAVGMLITFLYLWSNDLRDITGAGLGFVAGAVMLSSGVLSLTVLSLHGACSDTAVKSSLA